MNVNRLPLHTLAAAATLLVSSSCGTTAGAPARPGFLAKSSARVVRVMTWNVGRDSIFAGGADYTRHEQFARVVRAIRPDVVCLQEVWRGSSRAAALFDELLPQADGRRWQHHGVLDDVIVSRLDLSLAGEGTVDVEESRK